MITRLIRENVPGSSSADYQSPEVLIVSPTRELTLQIYNEARKFIHESIYRPVVVYGGTSVGHQLRQLEMGCNILVGTPGRLGDFLNRKKVGARAPVYLQCWKLKFILFLSIISHFGYTCTNAIDNMYFNGEIEENF